MLLVVMDHVIPEHPHPLIEGYIYAEIPNPDYESFRVVEHRIDKKYTVGYSTASANGIVARVELIKP